MNELASRSTSRPLPAERAATHVIEDQFILLVNFSFAYVFLQIKFNLKKTGLLLASLWHIFTNGGQFCIAGSRFPAVMFITSPVGAAH